jgi:hypothetical protein
MSQQPAALQLRLLQTVVAVAAEKNSTLVLPFPVELLRFLERAQSQAPAHAESAQPIKETEPTELIEPAGPTEPTELIGRTEPPGPPDG